MNGFILMLQENISGIVAVLAGGNILLIVSTIIRTFSQRNLNRSFDAFKEGAAGLLNKNMTVEQTIGSFTGVITDVKGSVKTLSEEIKALDVTTLYQMLNETIRELETVKAALDFKDEMIAAYNKDMYDIKLKLMQLEGASGYIETKVK